MFKFLLFCFFLPCLAVATHSQHCAQARERYTRTFEEAFKIDGLKKALHPQSFVKLFPKCDNRCSDIWENVRAAAPDPCDASCWANIKKAFLWRHDSCKGVVEKSCLRRLGTGCHDDCRDEFLQENGDCADLFQASCYEKHALFERSPDDFLYSKTASFM